jgi:3-oxoacyl-[acyl-carrier protein] reductase
MADTARTILVTGAGSGIGAAVARAFAASGDHVHLLDISAERLASVAAELPEGAWTTHVADVTDFAGVGAVVASIDGPIDVLAGCAGVFDGLAGIEATTRQLWDRVIDINLTGTFNVVKPVAERMIAQKSGRIVLIGSIAAARALPDGLAYDASKAALEGMTRRLAVDLGPHGITANVVAPGVIRTGIRATSEEILGDVVPATDVGVGTNPELMKMLIPLQRAGDASEVAATVHFLAGDGGGYINGEVIHIDGGWIAT